MSNKAIKTNILIDGTEYKIIQEKNANDTHWQSIPLVDDRVPASGPHIIDKARERSHWDKFNGRQKLPSEKEYITPPPQFNAVIVGLKSHGRFPIPPDNPIAVLRGSDKPMQFLSLEYYNKHREKFLDKYKLLLGDENNPQVLEVK